MKFTDSEEYVMYINKKKKKIEKDIEMYFGRKKINVHLWGEARGRVEPAKETPRSIIFFFQINNFIYRCYHRHRRRFINI